jgi:hypothetical protein
MSEERYYQRDRVEYVRHGRPVFFDDPAVDKLLAMVTALLGEVCTLRERLDTHERLAAAQGVCTPEAVDAYVPDATAEQARAAMRELAIGRVMSVLTEEVVRLRHEAGGRR